MKKVTEMAQIYALSDNFFTPDTTIFSQMVEILNSGVKFIQYRSKKEYQNENLISLLISLCEDYGAKLIINDNVELAKKLNAHGVHIGKDDARLSFAKKILKQDKIIGVSCYDDINLAIKAQENGANYVAFGAMYKSKTKSEAKICSHEIIKKAKKIINVPICVIGGINMANLDEILSLNPDLIALVSAVYRPDNISLNLQNLQNKIRRNHEHF